MTVRKWLVSKATGGSKGRRRGEVVAEEVHIHVEDSLGPWPALGSKAGGGVREVEGAVRGVPGTDTRSVPRCVPMDSAEAVAGTGNASVPLPGTCPDAADRRVHMPRMVAGSKAANWRTGKCRLRKRKRAFPCLVGEEAAVLSSPTLADVVCVRVECRFAPVEDQFLVEWRAVWLFDLGLNSTLTIAEKASAVVDSLASGRCF